ncbi:hypothetical protein SAMN05660297_00112 [Natronincola peptidivorans]|uniref:Uncharacterized protein n=1 Tax=Natronincola peptidivorans TaxID=426128 RepID=A0A1H9Y9K6_9FIRM|nr:hypothetical protein [Natronincola peptidivorans]SES65509.1 hypothetical protein SAMN05660297_00112 [Natronincola peptidivorans]
METKDLLEKKFGIKELKQQQYLLIYEATLYIFEFALLTGCFFGLCMLLYEAFG